MKRYYNSITQEWYNEGQSMTKRVENGVFTGIPSEEQLYLWGYEEIGEQVSVEPTEADTVRTRMYEILSELQATDYLALKAFEGEDMSEHVGWKEHRAALRAEYRQLESELQNVESNGEQD